MEKEEILKAIMELPKVETDNPISTMYGINADDLISAIDRSNKMPTYDELLRENKKQKEIIDKAKQEIQNSSLEVNTREYGMLTVCNSDDLLQILEEKEK